MLTRFCKFSEAVLGKTPLFVIGSGLSMSAGVSGMSALATWLGQNVQADPHDLETWDGVQRRLSEKVGLEQALLQAGPSVSLGLREAIIQQTWRLITKDERSPLLKIANDQDLTGFRHLLERFAFSTNNNLHVVTTNYDHLIEWSASMAGWPVWDGFDLGHVAKPISNEDWGARMSRVVFHGRRTSAEPVRHLRLYKLHGSLSWFRLPDGKLIKIPGVSEGMLDQLTSQGFLPAIVTPGTDKYLETHSQPYFSIFSEMHSAIQAATAIIFVGFGFNDLHIQGGLEQKLRDRNVSKVMLSMQLSDPLRSILQGGGIQNFVAVEQAAAGGSYIRSDHLGEGSVSSDIWNFKGFLASAWGGTNVA